MRASRRSMISAIVLFVLIAAVVLGGMTWGTVATFQLSKKTVEEEHLTNVQRALWKIESHMTWILNTEASRAYTDYVHLHTVQPDVVLTLDRRQVDPDGRIFLEASPIAESGPAHAWIDIYFQVDQDGAVTSPQIEDENEPYPVEVTDAAILSRQRARQAWPWLENMVATVDLVHEVAHAFDRNEHAHQSATGAGPAPRREVPTDEREPVVSKGEPTDVDESRVSSSSQPQRGYLPPEECVEPHIADRNIRGSQASPSGIFDDPSEPGEKVEIKLGPIAPPFWLEPGPMQTRKLAFVRECLADADLFYQGFIGDWSRLKPELLAEIRDVFPDADLEPIANDAVLDPATCALRAYPLPVLLRVAGIPGGAAGAAWKSIRSQLLISWAAAVAVLAVAGWGVRNLVALTERRMQFAYAVTHELRTPLTTFRLYSDMLSSGLVPDGARQEYLDTLNRESLRLSSLVEGVLEYARLETQKVKLHLTDTDVPALLGVVGETLEKRCAETVVEARTHNNLTGERRLRTDVNLVNQIASILVNNACRHARGSKDPVVLVELGGENGKIHLDVVDSGPGIDLGDARKIFRPFRRGRDADAAARGGVGLGLALARNWATLLGGRLDLVARHHPQYHGAHFRLTIPTEPPS